MAAQSATTRLAWDPSDSAAAWMSVGASAPTFWSEPTLSDSFCRFLPIGSPAFCSAQGAADVGTKVAQGTITQAEAAAQLEPIAAEVASLAEQNAGLPIGKNLQKLSDSVGSLQKVGADAPTDIQAAAESLGSQANLVVADCAAIGQ